MSGSAATSAKRRALRREPLSVTTADGAAQHVPVKDWVLNCGPGKRLDASILKGLESGSRVLYQANLYLRDQASPVAAGNRLLRYFRSVQAGHGQLGAESLAAYRSQLDVDAHSQVNTKSQVYGAACGFISRLMRAGILPEQDLPLNFKAVPKKPHPTFAQLAGVRVSDAILGNEDRLDKIKHDQRLDDSTATALLFNIIVLERIHSKSMDELQSRLEDCDFVNQLIDDVDESGRAEATSSVSFNSYFGAARTLDEAFLILFSKFGFDLPVTDQWPPGIYNFLKAREINAPDVKKIFSEDRERIRAIAASADSVAMAAARAVEDWTHEGMDHRSVPLALGMLYAKHGRILPKSTAWPDGVVDYLKYRGWSVSRVASAFFPSSRLHSHLMMMLLSHKELAPNVSSVLIHASIDAVLEGAADGAWDAHFGKKRGGPASAVIDSSDRAMILARRYQAISRRALLDTSEGKVWLKKENCPLMLRVGGKGRKSAIGKYNMGDAALMAERAMKMYASSTPLLGSIKDRACARSFRSTIASVLRLEGIPLGKIKSKLNHKHYSTTVGYVGSVVTETKLRGRQLDFQEMLLREVHNTGAAVRPNSRAGADVGGPGLTRLVLTDDSAVALWLAWIRDIEASEARLMFENPARWSGYWHINLAEYKALLSKIPSSQKKRAQEIAMSIVLPRIE